MGAFDRYTYNTKHVGMPSRVVKFVKSTHIVHQRFVQNQVHKTKWQVGISSYHILYLYEEFIMLKRKDCIHNLDLWAL